MCQEKVYFVLFLLLMAGEAVSLQHCCVKIKPMHVKHAVSEWHFSSVITGNCQKIFVVTFMRGR